MGRLDARDPAEDQEGVVGLTTSAVVTQLSVGAEANGFGSVEGAQLLAVAVVLSARIDADGVTRAVNFEVFQGPSSDVVFEMIYFQ